MGEVQNAMGSRVPYFVRPVSPNTLRSGHGSCLTCTAHYFGCMTFIFSFSLLFKLDGINSGSWYHYLPICIYIIDYEKETVQQCLQSSNERK